MPVMNGMIRLSALNIMQAEVLACLADICRVHSITSSYILGQIVHFVNRTICLRVYLLW